MKKNAMLPIACLSILLLFFIQSSCNHNKENVEITNKRLVDSVISDIQDSISNNSQHVQRLVNYGFSIVKDSFQYFQLIHLKAYTQLNLASYDSVDLSLRQTIRYCESIPPSLEQNRLLSSTYNVLGSYYSRTGNNDSSFFYYQKAYNQANKGVVTDNFPNIIINLADMYKFKNDYANSAYYYRRALFISDSIDALDEFGFPIYTGLGQVFQFLHDFELSDQYFKMAEKEVEKRNLNEKFFFYTARGNYYYYHEEYQAGLKWFKKAQDLVSPYNYQYAINLTELNMSDIYLNLNQLDSAHYYAERALPFFSQIQHVPALYYLTTIRAGIAIKQHQTALANSILKENTDTIGIEKYLVSIRYKFMRDLGVQKGDYKKAYLYEVANNQMNNSIQSEQVKKRVAELDMRYKHDTTVLKRDLQIQAQHNEMASLRNSRYLLILIILLVLLVVIFVYFYMQKRNDLQQMKHLDQAMRLRLENARSRISPHFLFNTLNTIQDELTDKPDTNKRLKAIVGMLRSSLLNVEKTAISLKEEIEFIDNYILLQKAKYIRDLKTEINIENEDLHLYKVPAMIIQIPVENAIKHGLAKKESGEKILKVNARRDNGTLRISVTDNGVGRELSTLNSGLRSTGTGLKVIGQTLHLLNSKNENNIKFSLLDIKDETGKNCGTQVNIEIPVDFNYEL